MLQEDYQERGITITEVASGFRMQVKAGMAERLEKLWEERPPRYSRALFETLALIAYRQPMTRGEIEEIRGVAVSTNIIRSLLEREWVRVVGHRDVPGRPAMFATTKIFLDYFGLKKLEDLPPLADLSDWESLRVQLNLPAVDEDESATEVEAETGAETGAETATASEIQASADIPVLYAQEPDTAEAAEDEPDEEAVAAAESLVDGGFEEIVASAWPDPSEHLGGATREEDALQNEGEPEDSEASVGGA